MRIAVSAGHGLHIRGASGPAPWGLDEYNENVRVMEAVGQHLADAGVACETYTDVKSTTQDANLSNLVNWHNKIAFGGGRGDDRLDVSIHFNAYQVTTTTPRGTEVWWMTQQALAGEVSAAIAKASGLINRGAKYSDTLYFLRHTASKSILIETAFCDSKPDCDLYRQHFDALTRGIANAIADLDETETPTPPPHEDALFVARGRCSWFGGPDDTGVSPSESLAFITSVDQARHLFLPTQPPNTTGLARRLDPRTMYCACRWDYQMTPKAMLVDPIQRVKCRNPANGYEAYLYPGDWGPHESTGRIADLSPGAMELLQLATDDTVEITYPAP